MAAENIFSEAKEKELERLKNRVRELEDQVGRLDNMKNAHDETKAKYRHLVEQAPTGIYEVDLTQNRLVDANEVLSEYMGYSLEEIFNLSPFDLLHPESHENFTERAKKLAAGESVPDTVEYRLNTKNGRELWGKFHGKIIYADGKPQTAHVVVHDITEQKKIRNRLDEIENLLEAVTYHLPALIAYLDTEQRYRYVNNHYEEWFARPKDEIIGRTVIELLGEKAYEKVRAGVEKALNGQKNSYTVKIPTADGKTRYFHSSNIPHYSTCGTVIGYFVFAEDITEQLKTEEALRKSEEKYRTFIETLPDIVYRIRVFREDVTPEEKAEVVSLVTRLNSVDRSDLEAEIDRLYDKFLPYVEGTIIEANDVALHVTGYKRDHIGRIGLAGVVAREHLENAVRNTLKLLALKSNRNEEYELMDPKGARIIASVNANLNEDQYPYIVQGVIRDITDYKRAEEELRISEERYRTIVDNSHDGIAIIDEGFELMYVNDEFCNILGYIADELIGRKFQFFLAEETRDIVVQNYQRRISGELAPSRYEFTVVRKDGAKRWVEVNASKLETSEGKTRSIAQLLDITERKLADDALRESEKKFATLFRFNPGAMSLVHLPDHRLMDVNDGFCEMFGLTREDVIGKTYHEAGIADYEPGALEELNKILERDGGYRELEFTYRKKDGTIGTALSYAERIEIQGEPHFIAVAHDLTLRKRAEEKAWQLAFAVDQADEAITIFDADSKIQYVNPAFERITEYTSEDVLGMTPHFLYQSQQDRVAFDASWEITTRQRKTWSGLVTNKTKSGKAVEMIATISPLLDAENEICGFISLKRDITEQRKLESQLRQAQKMEAIGTLAGGIAHDFNNILTVIQGYAQMALKQAPEGSKIRNQLESLFNAGKRATDLVRQILVFSRQADRESRPIDFNQVLNDTLKLIRSLIPKTIEIRNEIQSTNAFVLADPTEIHQILLNLSTNAFHAIGDNAGILTIGTEIIRVSDQDELHKQYIAPGDYVLLRVNDDGQGIEQEILERIFDPYFTTKPKSEGTGLGLAMVHGIVQNYGGVVRVYSEIGVGTTFNIYLPMIPPETPRTEQQEDSLPRGTERILLVDDEEVLLLMEHEMLEELGYKVSSFSSSIEALEDFKTDPDQYDMVITDQTMPMMTGMNLAKEILSIKPDVPIIICTGFSSVITPEKIREIGIRDYLMKPVLMEKLGNCIRETLDNKE